MNNVPDYMIPEWSGDIESYINRLTLAKEMELFGSDKNLIFHSLLRSNKQELILTLTQDQKTKLDDFIRFLRTNFGPSVGEKRYTFENISQNEEENISEYFKRVELSYFRSKNLSIPSTMAAYQKADIQWAFLKGMRNREAYRLLKLNPATIAYENLATVAAETEASLKDLERGEVNPVHAIDDSDENLARRINALQEQLDYLKKSYQN